MKLMDELERLSQLHRDGELDDDEFLQAKKALLAADHGSDSTWQEHDTGGQAVASAAGSSVAGELPGWLRGAFGFGGLLVAASVFLGIGPLGIDYSIGDDPEPLPLALKVDQVECDREYNYCGVLIEARNTGDESVDVASRHLKLIDTNGREYDVSSDTYFSYSLNPGRVLVDIAGFDVAPGSTPEKLRVAHVDGSAAEVSLKP